LQAALNPSLLRCEPGEKLVIKDDATGTQIGVTREDVHGAISEFKAVVQFICDWQAGLFTLTRSEYERFPAVLVDIRRAHSKAISNGNQGR
jgi:hypothetical protein